MQYTWNGGARRPRNFQKVVFAEDLMRRDSVAPDECSTRGMEAPAGRVTFRSVSRHNSTTYLSGSEFVKLLSLQEQSLR